MVLIALTVTGTKLTLLFVQLDISAFRAHDAAWFVCLYEEITQKL